MAPSDAFQRSALGARPFPRMAAGSCGSICQNMAAANHAGATTTKHMRQSSAAETWRGSLMSRSCLGRRSLEFRRAHDAGYSHALSHPWHHALSHPWHPNLLSVSEATGSHRSLYTSNRNKKSCAAVLYNVAAVGRSH